MGCAERPQQLLLFGFADDIDQRDAVLLAELDQHLAEV
jgi:hypothetical protein